MEAFSQRYDSALILAARAHKDQVRKAGDIPYVVHPVHVSVILLRYGFPEDVAIAGLLHDVVEDSDVPLSRIEAGYGPAVAEIVAALTERKVEGSAKRPWEDRKREALEKTRGASADAVAVKAADVLHNARSLAWQLRHEGPSVWNKFTRGPESSLWYYQSIADIVGERLGAHPLAGELGGAIQDLERVIAETDDN